MSSSPNPVRLLRALGLVEAVSFLFLLGVAMPLKYLAHLPLAVKIGGMIHGLLFLCFAIALVQVKARAHWPWSRAALAFVAVLLPFGPFFLESRMRRYEAEFLASQP